MLKGLDPLLNADLLYVLAAMGHGDELALVDKNFPAVSLGARVIRLEGVDAPRVLEAILSVMPLDDMLDTPYTRMVDLGFAEVEESEICREFVRIVERHEGPRWQIGRIDRFGFYDRARSAFAVVVTGETRVNGSLLLTKGIVRASRPDPGAARKSCPGGTGRNPSPLPPSDLSLETSSRARSIPVILSWNSNASAGGSFHRETTMVVGRRYLIRQTSGDLVELSHRDFDRADDRIAPITGLAGRCVEMVSVVVVEAPDLRRTVSDVAFTKVYFDADGFIDVSKRDLMIRLMLESCADRRSSVVAAALDRQSLTGFAHRARGRLDREFRWRPDRAVLNEVMIRFDLPLSDGLGRSLLDMNRTLH